MKNLRLALRSLFHFKGYTIINILGLALSLACVIIIFRYLYNESTVDHYISNLDRLYTTIQENKKYPERIRFSGVENRNNEKSFVDLRQDPAVECSSDFFYLPDDEISAEDVKYAVRAIATDTNFLKLLDYPVVYGSNDLSRPESAVISYSFAQKIFGDIDPVGKQITYNNLNESLTVVGVLGTPSTKNSLHFDLLVSSSLTPHWSRMSNTLVLLYPDQDYKAFNEKYSDFFEMPVWGYSIRHQLFPMKDVYLEKSIRSNDVFLQGNSTTLTILWIVGLLILLVGTVNYVNIYTAVILRRGREFGMKKVFGAHSFQIFIQLLVENALMIGLGVILALAFTEIFSPLITNLFGFNQLPFKVFDILLSLGLLGVLSLSTTIFPFFHYNYSTPIDSLRSVGKTGGKFIVRKAFLVFQYVLTGGMIIVSLFFLKQLHFMLNADLGFRTEDIIQTTFLRAPSTYVYRAQSEEKEREAEKIIRQKMEASPLFSAFAFSESPIGAAYEYQFSYAGKDEFKPAYLMSGDAAWFNVFGIELLDGRFFDDEIDRELSYCIIVTESALSYFGISDFRNEKLQPVDRLWFSSLRDAEEMKTNPPYEIVGVVKDFYTSYLGTYSPPIVLTSWGGSRYDPLTAVIVPGKKQEAIDFLRQLHEETVGGEFTYSFVEDQVQEMYKEDRKISTVYAIFTLIAIFISALGLYSMSLYDVQQRYKEIAIRKVNGASTVVILGMLLKRYFYLLLISFAIAVPVAILAIQSYLQGVAYKTTVSWWIFVLAFTITAAVSLLTLIWHTRKAANTNPAEVIRSE